MKKQKINWKSLKIYLINIHRDYWDWLGILYRIFTIALFSYLIIIFIQDFGDFIQWKSGYTKTVSMGPIAWLCGFIYFFIKTLTIVYFLPSKNINEDEKSEEKNYKIRVDAPAIEGEANRRLFDILSEYFKVKKSSISIIRGFKSKNKIIEIDM